MIQLLCETRCLTFIKFSSRFWEKTVLSTITVTILTRQAGSGDKEAMTNEACTHFWRCWTSEVTCIWVGWIRWVKRIALKETRQVCGEINVKYLKDHRELKLEGSWTKEKWLRKIYTIEIANCLNFLIAEGMQMNRDDVSLNYTFCLTPSV